MIDKILLGFLHHGNMTGYDIKKIMETSTNYFYSASYGSINPVLRKLEKAGLVTAEEMIENGRHKKVYTIGDKGRLVFSEWLEAEIPPSPAKEESLLRIFFYSHLSKERALELLRNYQRSLEKEREELVELKGLMGQCHPEMDIDTSYHAATLLFGIDYYEFVKKWFEGFIERLEGSDS